MGDSYWALCCAVVSIFKSDYVIFSEVGAGLHFDDFQGLGPGVFQAVLRTHGDVGRFVLIQVERIFIAGDLCSTADDDPVLGALVMVAAARPSPRRG